MDHEVSPATPQATKKDGPPLSYHPDIMSPGLEARYNNDQGKEVVPQAPEEQNRAQAYYSQDGKYSVESPAEKKRRRICGTAFPIVLLLLLILLIALGVGLGVGLGIGLKKKYVEQSLGIHQADYSLDLTTQMPQMGTL